MQDDKGLGKIAILEKIPKNPMPPMHPEKSTHF